MVNRSSLKIFAKEVPKPEAVRYAWEDNPGDANLINSEGLPRSVRISGIKISNPKKLKNEKS